MTSKNHFLHKFFCTLFVVLIVPSDYLWPWSIAKSETDCDVVIAGQALGQLRALRRDLALIVFSYNPWPWSSVIAKILLFVKLYTRKQLVRQWHCLVFAGQAPWVNWAPSPRDLRLTFLAPLPLSDSSQALTWRALSSCRCVWGGIHRLCNLLRVEQVFAISISYQTGPHSLATCKDPV